MQRQLKRRPGHELHYNSRFTFLFHSRANPDQLYLRTSLQMSIQSRVIPGSFTLTWVDYELRDKRLEKLRPVQAVNSTLLDGMIIIYHL